jgi:CRP/FNR family transcriptional regulator
MAKFLKTADCKNCGLKLNLFCYLTEDQLEGINDKRNEVQFKPGETIFKSGGPLTHILCLTSGMVKIHLEDYSDKKILIGIVKPVQLLGGPGFLVDERHYVTATAMEETTACYISTKDFKKVMKVNPEFSMELVRHLNQQIINYFELINVLAHKHMHGKLADTFLYLADTIYNNDAFETSLSRQDLADMSAMTKESAIRVMKEFKNEGIINYNTTHFEILNKKALINISRKG